MEVDEVDEEEEEEAQEDQPEPDDESNEKLKVIVPRNRRKDPSSSSKRTPAKVADVKTVKPIAPAPVEMPPAAKMPPILTKPQITSNITASNSGKGTGRTGGSVTVSSGKIRFIFFHWYPICVWLSLSFSCRFHLSVSYSVY